MMRLQPPKADIMKNYYLFNLKSSGKLKKYQEPPKKPTFGAKVRPHTRTPTTVAPRILDGFYERSDKTMVFADESNNVYIAARQAPGPVSRSRSSKVRPEDLNTGEYLPDTDFFVIDAKDFGQGRKLPRTDATDAEEIGLQRRHDHHPGRLIDAMAMARNDIGDDLRSTNHNTHANHIHTHNRNAAPRDNGERMEFQMHGFNGPDSYKFGYDTGKG